LRIPDPLQLITKCSALHVISYKKIKYSAKITSNIMVFCMTPLSIIYVWKEEKAEEASDQGWYPLPTYPPTHWVLLGGWVVKKTHKNPLL
jgi:hypothetical protein